MKLLMLLALTTLSFSSLESAGWIDRKAEGWAWYEDKSPVELVEKEPDKPLKSAQEQISDARKQLEETLAEALIAPTESNIRVYLEEQKKLMLRSAHFSHIWEKVLLQNPELDPTATVYPVTQYGIQLQKEIDNENNKQLISALAKKNGLFFFYEGQNKISQALAKIVKRFSEKYQWDIVAISIDGSVLEGFEARVDNGMAKSIGISIFPALFVISPSSKIATPIAYGFVSLDQIESRIVLQFKDMGEDRQ